MTHSPTSTRHWRRFRRHSPDFHLAPFIHFLFLHSAVPGILQAWFIKLYNGIFKILSDPDQMKTIGYTIARKHLAGIFALIFVMLWANQTTAFGQKVGLVLSGGGAKGAAHIGVIRALEEEGIPIDYITGTSIGAIIGGLYAIGWSPDQMEEVILSKEFKNWVSAEIEDEYKFYFKMPNPNAAWLNLKFSVDSVFKPKLPVNLVSPSVMDFVFMELYSAAAANANYNFDSLFVPFRCMAADILENKAIALRNGDLGHAIRASMTFPFYFRPITIEGRLLFDGGMYNNFPSDVMYDDFFPDIIIGSRVAGNYADLSVDNLTSQLAAMLTSSTSYEIPCDNGVMIRPNVRDVNVIDFRHSKSFIDSGYVETKRMIPQIRAYVFDTITQSQVNERREQFIENNPPLIVERIFVEGLEEKQTRYVNRMLRLGEERLPLQKIKHEYFKLLTDDKISHISPQLKYNRASGYYDLYLDVRRENEITVEFGGNVSSSAINSAYLGIRYNLLGQNATTVSLNSYVGRFYSSAQAAARFDFSTAIPFYIEPSVTYNQWDYFTASTYFFEDKTPSFLKQNEISWTVLSGVPVKTHGRFISGLTIFRLKDDYYQTNFFSRIDTADQTRFKGFTPYAMYERNTLNHKQFANSGKFFNLTGRLVYGVENHIPGSTSLRRYTGKVIHTWWQFRVKYENYLELSKPYRLGLYGEAIFSNQDMFSNYTATLLTTPAFHPIPVSKTYFSPEYRAHSFAAAGLRNILILRRNLDLRFEVYAFSPHRPIIRDENFMAMYGSEFSTVNFAGSAGVVFHSPIGPVNLSVNYFNKNENPVSVLFNLGYIIFNQKALD